MASRHFRFYRQQSGRCHSCEPRIRDAAWYSNSGTGISTNWKETTPDMQHARYTSENLRGERREKPFQWTQRKIFRFAKIGTVAVPSRRYFNSLFHK